MTQSFDAQTVDSTGVFFATQLNRIDPVLNTPLADFTYARDIDIAPLDVADEQTSFDSVKYAATGGVEAAGPSFVSSKVTEIGTVGVDLQRVTAGTFLWAQAVQKTVIELAQAQKLGRPLDAMLLDAMNMKLNVDMQNHVYLGYTPNAGTAIKGLLNSTQVTAATVATGVGGFLWTQKTDDEILADINTLLTAAWQASGFTIMPDRLGLPPLKFSYLVSRKIANQTMSLLTYLSQNTMANNINGKPLDIVPMREAVGAGAGATDRMIAYRKRADVVRIPKSPVLSVPVQFVGLYQKAIYYTRFGTVEFVKPEAVRYADGF
mgnify:CR=1 FL=1